MDAGNGGGGFPLELLSGAVGRWHRCSLPGPGCWLLFGGVRPRRVRDSPVPSAGRLLIRCSDPDQGAVPALPRCRPVQLRGTQPALSQGAGFRRRGAVKVRANASGLYCDERPPQSNETPARGSYPRLGFASDCACVWPALSEAKGLEASLPLAPPPKPLTFQGKAAHIPRGRRRLAELRTRQTSSRTRLGIDPHPCDGLQPGGTVIGDSRLIARERCCPSDGGGTGNALA